MSPSKSSFASTFSGTTSSPGHTYKSLLSTLNLGLVSSTTLTTLVIVLLNIPSFTLYVTLYSPILLVFTLPDTFTLLVISLPKCLAE